MSSSKAVLPSAFSSFKISQLKSLLTSIGANTSGTKPVLASRLSQELVMPKLRKGKERILSIDMGIKNLAFCICDIHIPQHQKSAKQTDRAKPDARLKMEVVAWKRIAVDDKVGNIVPVTGRNEDARNTASESDKDPYHPRNMSLAACRLLHDVLLPYKPSTILIERQRFRSGGGSAIQEWTVRVNMLESMLWAVLTTLRMQSSHSRNGNRATKSDTKEDHFPTVFDVSPARVGTFWMASSNVQGLKSAAPKERRGKAKASRKVEKKDKIALVEQWLTFHDDNTSAPGRADYPMELKFVQGAEETKEAFLAKKARRVSSDPITKAQVKSTREIKSQKNSEPAVPVVLLNESQSVRFVEETRPTSDVGKLDDLADCLLQAAAWVRWESNRDTIQRGGSP